MISDPSLSFPSQLPRDYIIGVLLILFCTPLAAGETISVRFLGKNVHFLFHVIILGAAVTGVGLIMGGFTLPELWTDKTSVLLGIVAGMVGFVGQSLINKGFQLCRASTGTILRYVAHIFFICLCSITDQIMFQFNRCSFVLHCGLSFL